MEETIVVNADEANALLNSPRVEICGMVHYATAAVSSSSILVVKRAKDSKLFFAAYKRINDYGYFEGGELVSFTSENLLSIP
jgi:hypothetical protein